jgi:hypothetical protein
MAEARISEIWLRHQPPIQFEMNEIGMLTITQGNRGISISGLEIDNFLRHVIWVSGRSIHYLKPEDRIEKPS